MLSFLTALPLGDIVAWGTVLVTAANVITAATPTRSDNAVVDFISKILNFLAMNFLGNKNADDLPK